MGIEDGHSDLHRLHGHHHRVPADLLQLQRLQVSVPCFGDGHFGALLRDAPEAVCDAEPREECALRACPDAW